MHQRALRNSSVWIVRTGLEICQGCDLARYRRAPVDPSSRENLHVLVSRFAAHDRPQSVPRGGRDTLAGANHHLTLITSAVALVAARRLDLPPGKFTVALLCIWQLLAWTGWLARHSHGRMSPRVMPGMGSIRRTRRTRAIGRLKIAR